MVTFRDTDPRPDPERRPVSNHFGRAQERTGESDAAHERALENMRALDRDIAAIVAQAAPPSARHSVIFSPCSCGTTTEASLYPGETREIRCVSCARPLARVTMRP